MTQPISRICRAVMLALLLGGTAGTSVAAPTTTGGESEADRILRQVVEDAKLKVNADDYVGALRVLVDGYDRAPHPALLWPIAELYLQLKQPTEGLKILERYVMLVPTSKMPPGQQLAEVVKLREQFSAMFAKLTVISKDPGATLMVDRKPAGVLPLAQPLQLDPGVHRIELQVARSSVKEVDLSPGDTRTIGLVLDYATTAKPVVNLMPRRHVRTAALVLGGIGLGGVIAGSVLWGLDGMQSCAAAPRCPTALDTKSLGIGLLAGGLGLSVTSAVILVVESRR